MMLDANIATVYILHRSTQKLICDFLTLFGEMMNLIFPSSYQSANLYFMQVWKIEKWLISHEDSYLKEKFDKYWEEYSDVLAIVAVFDPRMKFTFIEYYSDNLNADSNKSSLDHVHKKLKKFFEV